MSTFDDNQDMRAQSDELLLTGHAVPDEPGLVDLVATLRRTVDAPAPRPTPALAMLLRDGIATTATVPVRAAATARARRRLGRLWRYVAGLGLAGKIALGAGIAFAGVTGAATVGAVPAVIQAPARAVVNGVEHLFAPRANVPVVPVPTSSATPSPTTDAPRPTSSGEPPAFSGHGPASRPTPWETAPGVLLEGPSSQAARPDEGTPTLPPQAATQATENADPGSATVHGKSDVAPSATPSAAARSDKAPAHP